MTTAKAPLTAKKQEDGVLLKPKGNLVASTVEAHRTAMTKALDGSPGSVVLDLTAVDQIDSLGITLVLGLFKTCQKSGSSFRIQSVKPDIMRVFKLFNLPKFFSITEAES